MQYTIDDYKRDLQIVALGSSGVEGTAAELRIRLYEAGRYEQLNALIRKEREPELAFDRLLEEKQRIDDDVFQSQLLWLNTSCSDPDLRQKRKEEFERKQAAGEAKKAQLQEEYEKSTTPKILVAILRAN